MGRSQPDWLPENVTLLPVNILQLVLIAACTVGCAVDNTRDNSAIKQEAFYDTITIVQDGVRVELFVDRPAGVVSDIFVAYHGTVWYDNLLPQAARNIAGVFRERINDKSMVIIGVAYPQEDKRIGDGLTEAAAALEWVMNRGSEEWSVLPGKLFLGGHSQGGYIVTRLNTMFRVDGVIANAPGPLDLEFRCLLEENDQIAPSRECDIMREDFGLPSENPQPYIDRSLLSFTSGYQSDILFVQGLNDGPIQMRSWPLLQQRLSTCTDCQQVIFLPIQGAGHDALFSSPQGQAALNTFINNRR